MESMIESLSGRGQRLAANPARVDFELFNEAMHNLYHAEKNPEGAFPLNIAENAVSKPLIKEYFEGIMAQGELPAWTLKYTHSLGHPKVREAVATFMRRYFGSQAIKADTLAFSAGASASLEISSFVLAEEGDVVAIPAPSYPMYTKDLGIKSGMERYDIQTHTEIEGKDSLALLEVEHLETAWKDIRARGRRFRILMLTTPDNPTGSVYPYDRLQEIAQWCIEHEVHLIVNEIYAQSLVDTSDPLVAEDFGDLPPYRSFSCIMADRESEYLHLIYGLSKDFAISGFRFGIVHSLNSSLLQGIGNANIPHMVSNVAQWLVGELFSDQAFIESYIEKNRRGLTESYKVAIRGLREIGVPYTPVRGSLFIWADFSQFLTAPSSEAEEALWIEIYQKTGVLLTPGKGFEHRKYGLFRLVYTAVPLEELKVVMSRLGRLAQ